MVKNEKAVKRPERITLAQTRWRAPFWKQFQKTATKSPFESTPIPRPVHNIHGNTLYPQVKKNRGNAKNRNSIHRRIFRFNSTRITFITIIFFMFIGFVGPFLIEKGWVKENSPPHQMICVAIDLVQFVRIAKRVIDFSGLPAKYRCIPSSGKDSAS